MLFFSCKTMRWLVMLAGCCFFSGIGLQLCSNLFDPGEVVASSYVSYTAFFLVMSGPILLLSTVILALLPFMRERLETCEH